VDDAARRKRPESLEGRCAVNKYLVGTGGFGQKFGVGEGQELSPETACFESAVEEKEKIFECSAGPEDVRRGGRLFGKAQLQRYIPVIFRRKYGPEDIAGGVGIRNVPLCDRGKPKRELPAVAE